MYTCVLQIVEELKAEYYIAHTASSGHLKQLILQCLSSFLLLCETVECV